MPRSGTSLIEQILSSHDKIFGAGELDFLNDIEKELNEQNEQMKNYPECILPCDKDNILEFSENYIRKIENISQNSVRVTDKMPDNYLRTGLIKLLFPKARIIHCRRNPLDTCISIYLNFINIKGNEYSFDLNDIGEYYLDYLKMMKHWNNLFSSEIYNLQYEDIGK